ncbi:MAG: histidinol-phosphate transaminase [Gammaproteobacteria bacterium]|nr:MAG: histidinol-phosphate transaminase [Gammaproteobacteria bacterium]
MSQSIDRMVRQIIRPEVRAMQAYDVASADGLIKLDAMENPYTWPDDIRQSWAEKLRDIDLNRYPDAAAETVKQGLRGVMPIPQDMDIMLGNGSDELILLIALAVNQRDRSIMAPVPTFVMYEVIARTVGMSFVGLPLSKDFDLDLPIFLDRIQQVKPAAIFLSYPNNPSGNLFSASDIEAILKNSPGLVIIDEAYSAFTDASFMSRLGEFDNLLVLRTVSKIGLAGLRLGLLVGPEAWLQEFNKLRLPYNINTLTQVSADFIFQHADILQQQTTRIRQDRDGLLQSLGDMAGITAWPSATNFILFRTEGKPASVVFKQLKASGVLLKNLHGSHPLLQDCLRVTIGTGEENAAFLSALQQAL